MSILVTGGAGYIGSHTCVELLNEDYEIVVVDNFSNSKPESLNRVREITGKDFPVYKADILDREALTAVFKENDVEAIIHFAGLKAVGESVSNPLRYYENNITGTLNLCGVMEKFTVNKMVFSSSATVYGLQDGAPFHEDLPLQATNPYGRTKLMIEDILRDIYTANQNWGIALLRYFNPIGAHHSGLIGEDPNGVPNNLLPYISQVAVGKLKKLTVFGNDYPTHDGTGIRDYIHVVDLAKGHLKALEKVLNDKGVEAYNLGTGNGYSVLEMIQTFENVSCQKIPYDIQNRRPGDIAISFADPSKAQRGLNWQAEKDCHDMCLDSWQWQKNNPDGYAATEKQTEVKA
ncbi:UDP-glucose 4-epimerase GalE [Salipaludibacillus sp. CUR1]|uniref:UDP-glucose 4-epimerase GalE n=1 Tax=Salipaludibacillus sp. CUR1 TaxID=2820003 RepID=UPI001E5EE71D|nr:UDP-glucose 4-epimerase GalE [Salipaludibacillus sp. CUR1]MCE7792766.1 UDP-glucose 4-epimerase GalE [Salipaludibacillus sp. CUR1]